MAGSSGIIVPVQSGMRKSCLPAVAAIALLSAPIQFAQAQITVDRESVMLNPENAAERSANLTVRNNGSSDMRVSVALEDWDVDASGASHWRKAGAVAGSCGRRVSVSPAALKLAPGEQQTVRVALKSDAKFDAECWSAAVVRAAGVRAAVPRTNVPREAGAGKSTNDSTTAVQNSIPLFVTPSGLNIDGELSDMYVAGDSLEVIYKNTGKQRTNIVGQVQVQTPDETVVLTVPLDSATVLAGATRKFRLAMPKLPKGQYVLVAIVDFGGEEMTAVQAALDMR